MNRNRKSKKGKSKDNLKEFLKKRAPIYLGIIGLFVIFIVPSFTEKNLENSLPNNFSEKEKQVLENLKSYKGTNNQGLTIFEAISEQIKTQYPDEKIYEKKETKVDLLLTRQNEVGSEYTVQLIFESYKGKLDYHWTVNLETGEVYGNNPEGKNIVRLVDVYN